MTSGTAPARRPEREERDAESPVRELRLALTVERYEEAVAFYRDLLGLPVLESFEGPGGGVVLDAGRVALEVADSAELASRLAAAGAEPLADPVVTPWSHRNVRLRAPDGLQLTLFTVLDDTGS